MYCQNCGNNLAEDAQFCSSCGQAVNSKAAKATTKTKAASGPSQENPGLVGFSDKSNSPEILEAARENRKTSIGCMWILVLVPLIGFPVAGLLMDDFPFGEALIIGVGIALIMLLVSLLALRGSKKPVWEGTVVNKYSKEKREHNNSDDNSYSTYTEYTTVISTDAGKKKTIVERNSQRDMYDYLAVGDRVRFHPRFGSYEKYDKSKDSIIYCNVCSKLNPIANDRCDRCNNLLFK
ncbi:MAG: zinc ribbon domain-containing protein [Eubacteriales bacterium]|nr:zinc ribbon domain-containing protein [Eubacteriales bacterium]